MPTLSRAVLKALHREFGAARRSRRSGVKHPGHRSGMDVPPVASQVVDQMSQHRCHVLGSTLSDRNVQEVLVSTDVDSRQRQLFDLLHRHVSRQLPGDSLIADPLDHLRAIQRVVEQEPHRRRCHVGRLRRQTALDPSEHPIAL